MPGLRTTSRLILIILAFVVMAACGWLNLDSMGDQALQMATSVAENSGPLQETSSSLFKTATTGGQTEMPPMLTQVARVITQVAIQTGPELKTSLLGEPHAHYQIVTGCAYSSYDCSVDAPHTGVDSINGGESSFNGPATAVVAAGPGVVKRIQFMRQGCSREKGDCGFGNTVILEHTLVDGSLMYSLYGHLDSISSGLSVGQCIPKGIELGTMGASGFGDRNYWPREHLHFELKTSAVLGDPRTAFSNGSNFPEGQYFGYLMDPSDPDPDHWGYRDPQSYLNKVQVRDCGQ